MERLRKALESLDEALFTLEDRMSLDAVQRTDSTRRHAELLKQSRAREVAAMGIGQKIATRLDQTIQHVERILAS